jgi:hypothetical protein
LVEVHHSFRGPCCLHHQGDDDGGSKDIWNVDKLLPDYTTPQPSHLHWQCYWDNKVLSQKPERLFNKNFETFFSNIGLYQTIDHQKKRRWGQCWSSTLAQRFKWIMAVTQRGVWFLEGTRLLILWSSEL